MQRLGDPPVRGRAYTDRPGAYGVIVRGDDLLLTVEDHPLGNGPDIQLPGGGIDPGEAPLQALHREVMEETGHTIAVRRKLGVYQRYCYMPEYDLWARKIAHVYLCRVGLRLSQPTESIHEIIWAQPDEAVHLITNNADGLFLAQVLQANG